jgi:hypothetical protein
MRPRAPFTATLFARIIAPLFCLLLLFLSSACGLQAPQDVTSSKTIKVEYNEVDSHRIGDRPFIRASHYTHDRSDIFDTMDFQIVVDESGAIVSSQLMRGDKSALPAVNAQLKTLKYQPFLRNDVPARAKFTEYVSVLPLEKIPSKHVPFPDTSDRSSIRMTLSRSTCLGTCPSYSVAISGDGTVDFKGGRFTAIGGEHHSQVSYDDISSLIEKFRAADFFSLDHEYRFNVTDNPTYIIAFTAGRKNKEVIDYVGQQVGMPDAVTKLENEIDRVSGSARWVKGTPVPSFDALGPSQ